MARLIKIFKLFERIPSFFKNPVFIIWIFLIIILYPIYQSRFFSIHDETHIVDVYEMMRSLQLGGFPPRFAPDFNFDLGHPYFNFYYHLPFYITTLFHYLGLSMTTSLKYMLGVAVILSASGFYFFLRNHTGKTASVFGSLVYILSPYFAVDLYVRGGAGEMYILALFPWAGFFLYRFLKKSSGINLALASISIFLIGISHNVLLPFILTLLFLYGAANLSVLKPGWKKSFKIFLPFILGILLAAYYLLPALIEVKYISSYEQFNIVDHFPFIKQLIIPHWGYGPSIWGYLDDLSFDIGTVNLILILLSFFIFKSAKKESRILFIFSWLIFGVAVILMNSRTVFFWESIRFLRLVQFPWRMLLLTTISTSLLAGLTIQAVLENYKKISPLFLTIILVLLTALNIWHYHPSEYKDTTDEQYLQRYFASQSLLSNEAMGNHLSSEYLNFTEDFIPPTIWQTMRPSGLMSPTFVTATASSQLDIKTHNLSYDLSYQTSAVNEIIVPKTYFPSWQATGEKGEKLEVMPYSEYGIIAIPVKAGSGSIHLYYGNTPIENAANIVSAVTAGVILVLLVSGVIKKKHD